MKNNLSKQIGESSNNKEMSPNLEQLQLRKSKINRHNESFGYLVENDPKTYSEAM